MIFATKGCFVTEAARMGGAGGYRARSIPFERASLPVLLPLGSKKSEQHEKRTEDRNQGDCVEFLLLRVQVAGEDTNTDRDQISKLLFGDVDSKIAERQLRCVQFFVRQISTCLPHPHTEFACV